jgi:Icc-related predicted phosphoesterase
MIKIVAISDPHGNLPEIPDCDLLLIGGDVTPKWLEDGEYHKIRYWFRNDFADWLGQFDFPKVAIGGNHDKVFQDSPGLPYDLPWTYLKNKATIVHGLLIWGSPMSPSFGNWAFMETDAALSKYWDNIPEDVDILMTHGPAFGIGDVTTFYTYGEPKHVGSATLRNKLVYDKYPQLKLHVSGHIHEAYGTYPSQRLDGEYTAINAAIVNEYYEPAHEPVVLYYHENTGRIDYGED